MWTLQLLRLLHISYAQCACSESCCNRLIESSHASRDVAPAVSELFTRACCSLSPSIEALAGHCSASEISCID
jgi:hypothetical protein